MNRELICVAKGTRGRWEAICLDLDIAVSGDSLEGVRGVLSEAVGSYISDAMLEQPETRDRLLNRRVPLLARLRWTWPFILAAIFGRKRRDAEETCEFPVTCPA